MHGHQLNFSLAAMKKCLSQIVKLANKRDFADHTAVYVSIFIVLNVDHHLVLKKDARLDILLRFKE